MSFPKSKKSLIIIIFLSTLILIAIFFPHSSSTSVPSSILIRKSTGAYAYENTTNNFQTYFKDSPIKESSVSFKTNRSQISFYTPQKQTFGNLNSSQSVAKDNTVTYQNVFTDTDLKYTLSPQRLLEEFIIKTPATALKFTQISQIANTDNIDRYQSNSDGSISFFYQDQLQFTLPKPVLYELSDQKNSSYGIKYQIIKTGENSYQIDKMITSEGLNWLINSNRHYPIAIDLVIDNADIAANWVSSDATNTVVSQETTIKHEGTGSVKVQTTADSTSTVDLMEYSSDSAAQTAYVTNAFDAIGGTITYSGLYKINTFTSNDTFTSNVAGNVNILVVGGGGGGGSPGFGQGGGGGGGVIQNSSFSVSSGATTVTVGGGGSTAANGANSVFSTLTAYGGGAGANAPNNSGANGFAGGSGGGASGQNMSGSYTGGAGSQGHKGGNVSGSSGDKCYASGGGGGAGAAGNDQVDTTHGGNGGAGISSSISGTATYYAGGGGGSGRFGSGTYGLGGGTGGIGGGGNGSASGGSGIVIVSYFYNTLQSYSESSLKTQGSYALKGVALAANSLNQTLTRTISSPLNLSDASVVTFDIRASRTGSNIKVGLHDTSGTTSEVTPNITSANTYQSATLDLSGVAIANKDAIDQIIITIVNADADNTFYLDNMVFTNRVSLNDTVTLTKTATNLSDHNSLSFWIYSTLAGQTLRFQFGETSSSEQTYNITINSANTWEQKTWNISGIGTSARDAVTKFAFQITDSTTAQTFYFDNLQTDNIPPYIPTLDSPDNNNAISAANVTFTLHTTDSDSDYVRYLLKLCTDLAMSVGCSSFDETASQVGWTGQDTQGSTAYSSGTTATYLLQNSLSANSTYYWAAEAIDPGGTNTWSGFQPTPYKFTTGSAPNMAGNCLLIKSPQNNSIIINWSDLSPDEDGFVVEKKIDGGIASILATLSAGTTGYTDNSVSSGHTYQYGVAPYYTGPVYGNWCITSILNLQIGNIQFSGLKMGGIKIN
jgi:hypothetical protein